MFVVSFLFDIASDIMVLIWIMHAATHRHGRAHIDRPVRSRALESIRMTPGDRGEKDVGNDLDHWILTTGVELA